jgi:hypothetical protein
MYICVRGYQVRKVNSYVYMCQGVPSQESEQSCIYYVSGGTKHYISLILLFIGSKDSQCRHGRDRIVVGFLTTYAINAYLTYISVISWWSVLLVEETGVPGGNHRRAASRTHKVR